MAAMIDSWIAPIRRRTVNEVTHKPRPVMRPTRDHPPANSSAEQLNNCNIVDKLDIGTRRLRNLEIGNHKFKGPVKQIFGANVP